MNRFVLSALLLVLLAGCGGSGTDGGASAVTIALHADTLAVGQTVLSVTLTDAAGAPAAAQKLDIRGDMTHAGMAPVIVEGIAGVENGVYRVPFEWTMRGDWIVTVTATLPDGGSAEKQFNLSIGG